MGTQSALIDHNDYDRYRELLSGWQDGRIDDRQFITERLRLGVYAQRQEGLCMVRAKLPGGRLTPRGLIGLAECLEHYPGHDVVHVTTRQDIQYHNVPLECTPDLLDRLGYIGWVGCEYRPRADTVAGLGWLDGLR